jgi:MerR family transcriptional regulator, mercuric resistance operon regulatory protein
VEVITPSRSETFTIGEVSRLTGVNLETIRYYERIRMLPAPSRTEGGRRVYGSSQVQRFKFIRRSRELGFTLDEIRNLLGLVEGGHACGEVQEAALAHLKTIRRKIADLRRMERTLANTAARCEGGTASNCPIVEILSKE